MEKIITIDGKDIGFKSSAAFLLRYRDYFGADGLKDLKNLQTLGAEGDLNSLIMMERMVWCLAKTYNKKVPPLEDWLDNFENFDIGEIFTELAPLINQSLGMVEQLDGETDAKNAEQSQATD